MLDRLPVQSAWETGLTGPWQLIDKLTKPLSHEASLALSKKFGESTTGKSSSTCSPQPGSR